MYSRWVPTWCRTGAARSSGAGHRVWATGSFNDWVRDGTCELNRRGDHFVGFIPDAKDGDAYKFHVEGGIGSEFKRDPYARELGSDPAYPRCNCILRDPANYPWSDQGWRTPPFNDLVIYQLHVGTFNGPARPHRVAKFLDVLGKLDYVAALGINAAQLLPVVEFASSRSLGYEGIGSLLARDRLGGPGKRGEELSSARHRSS